MLRHSRCHMCFVPDLSTTLSGNWRTGGGSDFHILISEQHKIGTYSWERRVLCRTRGNSWSGERVSRKRATYCRCASRLPLWQPGLTRCLCRWRTVGHYGTGTVEREGEREEGESIAQQASARISWKYQLEANLNHLECTSLSSFCVDWEEFTIICKENKDVYRAAGRVLGFFCFRYKAQLKK